jgi:non-homologous end joining protein Ku
VEDDRFVILEDEELEAVGLESTRTIDIERFVPRHGNVVSIMDALKRSVAVDKGNVKGKRKS